MGAKLSYPTTPNELVARIHDRMPAMVSPTTMRAVIIRRGEIQSAHRKAENKTTRRQYSDGTSRRSTVKKIVPALQVLTNWVLKAQRKAEAKSPMKFTEVRLPMVTGPMATATTQLKVRLVDGTVLRGSRVHKRTSGTRA
jgi:hypothetical protein